MIKRLSVKNPDDRFDRLCFSRYNPRLREAPRANISLNPADIRTTTHTQSAERFVITRDRRYVVVARVCVFRERAIPRSTTGAERKARISDYLPRDGKPSPDSRSVPIACRSRRRAQIARELFFFRVYVNCDL